MPEPLFSPDAYQAFLYTLPELYPSVIRSTLTYIASGRLFGRVEGMMIFDQNIVLCVQEYLNFDLHVIEGYGYEVSCSKISTDSPDFPGASEYCRADYPHKNKAYWYDSFPHPNDAALVSTLPHHKHVPPDIKHHRLPAPGLSFTRPNLPVLIEEVQRKVLSAD